MGRCRNSEGHGQVACRPVPAADLPRLCLIPRSSRRPPGPSGEHRGRRWTWPLVAALLIAAVIGALRFRQGPLDPNKVVVFPLGQTPRSQLGGDRGRGGADDRERAGIHRAAPVDRWPPASRRPASRQYRPAQLGRCPADRPAGGQWYMDGSVVRRSSTVAVGGAVERCGWGFGGGPRQREPRIAPQAAQAGLAAVNHLLPRLLSARPTHENLGAGRPASGRRGQLAAGGARVWRFNFPAALEFERRAVADDSALAVAALRGAQAASWLNDMPEAGSLAQVALHGVTLLPPRMADFTRGLQAYLTGQADSAVHWLTRALQQSPDWTEAHMALGEVYYHLLPTVEEPYDSLAQAEFLQAAADTGFTPPQFHLAEIAIRQGDVGAADKAVADLPAQVEVAGP